MQAPLSTLIDHILDTHHAYMKVQLPRVEARLAKVLHAHGDRHGDMLCAVARVYGAMKAELDGHLAKEEMVLFPLVRALEGGAPSGSFHCGSVQNPIRVMFMEHDSAGEALVELRRLTGGYPVPPDACNTFRALYFELEEMEQRSAPPHPSGKQHSLPPGDRSGIELTRFCRGARDQSGAPGTVFHLSAVPPAPPACRRNPGWYNSALWTLPNCPLTGTQVPPFPRPYGPLVPRCGWAFSNI